MLYASKLRHTASQVSTLLVQSLILSILSSSSLISKFSAQIYSSSGFCINLQTYFLRLSLLLWENDVSYFQHAFFYKFPSPKGLLRQAISKAKTSLASVTASLDFAVLKTFSAVQRSLVVVVGAYCCASQL